MLDIVRMGARSQSAWRAGKLKKNLAGWADMEQKHTKIPLVVVAGPTASGKTSLAVRLAQAFDGEVISADSMQIYQQMQIATARPDASEMKGIPHHLIGFVPPDRTSFSVVDYARLAHEAIREVHQRGKLPILAGGTGLYIHAVVDHLDFTEIRSDPAVRNALKTLAAERGNQYMLDLLRENDPELADRLHPGNLGRILRALEVYQLTGITMTEHQRRSRLKPSNYALCMLGISYSDRQMLYDRINLRVDRMLETGLVEEARQISRIYGGTARQAIGYKELQPYLDGADSLESCIDRLKRATMQNGSSHGSAGIPASNGCW